MNNKWTASERQFIIDNADTMKDREIAAILSKASGRAITLQAVRKQRQKLNIRKKPGRAVCGVIEQEEYTSHTLPQPNQE